MKFHLTFLPLLLLGVTSCGTVEKMNYLVNESTDSINRNVDYIRHSTCVIRENARLVDASTSALSENREHLEQGQ